MAAIPKHLIQLVASFGAVTLAACSASEPAEPEQPETRADRLGSQALAVVPLDASDPACAADPGRMDRSTLASCMKFRVDAIPEGFRVVKDPAELDPTKRNASILAFAPKTTRSPWVVVLGVGPRPAAASSGDGSLTTSSLAPQVAGALVGAAPLLTGEAAAALGTAGLVTGGAVLAVVTVAGLVYYVVSKSESESQELVEESETKLLDEKPCKQFQCTSASTPEYAGCSGKLVGAGCTNVLTVQSGNCHLEYGQSFANPDANGVCKASCTCSRNRVIP